MSNRANSPKSAGRGRGRGYGIDNSPLRKPNEGRPGSNTSSPKAATSPMTPKSSHSDTSVASSSSYLDATVQEFVPRMVKSQPSLSVAASSFVPTQSMNSLNVQSGSGAASHSPDEILIQFLEDQLFKLLMNPSSYDHSMTQFANKLSTLLVDKESMEIASDVVFEWAISKPNFSYTCARVCQYLAQNIGSINHNGTINVYLMKRCHKEHLQVAELLKSDQLRACSFAVFLAEIYTKPMGRMSKVMNAILEVIELMIGQLNDELAKTVGMVMKMCGACLEDDLSMTTPPQTTRMDTLVTNLSTNSSSGLDAGMSRFLASVVKLRNENWGRTVSPAQTPPQTPSSDFTNEPVFFSLSGQRITREQAGFAEDEIDSNGGWIGDGIPHHWSPADDITTTNESTGAGGDYSEADDMLDDLDILVIDDEAQMTEDMWADYEKFETERQHNMH